VFSGPEKKLRNSREGEGKEKGGKEKMGLREEGRRKGRGPCEILDSVRHPATEVINHRNVNALHVHNALVWQG
jgi:hypothetical protein